MIITVNGEGTSWPESELTVTELLLRHKVEKPDLVSVQVNGVFVSLKDYGAKIVVANDEVDFLYFLGGGQAA